MNFWFVEPIVLIINGHIIAFKCLPQHGVKPAQGAGDENESAHGSRWLCSPGTAADIVAGAKRCRRRRHYLGEAKARADPAW